MHSNTGRTRANAAASPPTMIDSAALIAPTSPPLTGASSIVPPLAVTADARRSVATGEMLLMSTTIAPLQTAQHAVRPREHELDVGVSGSIVMTMSERRATSAAGGRRGGAGRDKLIDRSLAAAVHDEVMALRDEVLGHRPPHHAEPDESHVL